MCFLAIIVGGSGKQRIGAAARGSGPVQNPVSSHETLAYNGGFEIGTEGFFNGSAASTLTGRELLYVCGDLGKVSFGALINMDRPRILGRVLVVSAWRDTP
jgi:hypothetical protein